MTDYELIDEYVDMLMKEGKKKYPESDGYPYALGYLQGKLGNIMARLKYNPNPAELYLELVEEMKKKVDGNV